MNFNDMSHEKLIIYCYDKRPDLYRRLTAKTTEAELRGWLHEPKPVIVQNTVNITGDGHKGIIGTQGNVTVQTMSFS